MLSLFRRAGVRAASGASLSAKVANGAFPALKLAIGPPGYELASLRAAVRRIHSSAKSSSSGSHTSAGAEAAEQGRRKAVGYWLAGTAGMVFVMVCIGGATRLTRSGLSIVEWKPTGEVFPTNDAAWMVEFEKYKAFPEYKKVNSQITLDEFKFIYFMEWFHRMWGRAIGVAFAAPLAYFAATKGIPKGLGPRLGVMLGLGAAQGGVGWWMVKSGLEHERFENNHKIPRVSPYRLATHLGFAFTVYSMLAYTAFDLLAKPLTAAQLTPQAVAAVKKIKTPAYLAGAIIALTAASGAFVAGNDAGHAYNDWPLMAGKFVPEEIWDASLGASNVFENTATVQFDHRMLAYTTLGSIGLLHAASKRAGGMRLMPAPVKRGLMVISGLVAAQIALGISTLMLYVPVSLGTAHQGGALALLTGALYLINGVRRVEREALKLGVSAPAAAAASAGVSPAKASAAAAAAFVAMVNASTIRELQDAGEDA